MEDSTMFVLWRYSFVVFVFVFILVGLAYGGDEASNSSNNGNGSCLCGAKSCACGAEAEGCDGWFAGCCDMSWTVRADGLLLFRSKPGDRRLVTNSVQPGGTSLLNANEFDLNVAGGWDVSVIRRGVLGTCWGVEGLYYGVGTWNASRGVVRSPTGAWVQFQTPVGNGAYPSDVFGDYRSSLHNLELNARREICPWGDVVIGYRYMDLRENGLTIFQNVLSIPTNAANYGI
jgi:hypothetical protein